MVMVIQLAAATHCRDAGECTIYLLQASSHVPNHGQQGQGPFYGQDFFESNRTQSATKGKLDST
jgi:hypothetical protein